MNPAKNKNNTSLQGAKGTKEFKEREYNTVTFVPLTKGISNRG